MPVVRVLGEEVVNVHNMYSRSFRLRSLITAAAALALAVTAADCGAAAASSGSNATSAASSRTATPTASAASASPVHGGSLTVDVPTSPQDFDIDTTNDNESI